MGERVLTLSEQLGIEPGSGPIVIQLAAPDVQDSPWEPIVTAPDEAALAADREPTFGVDLTDPHWQVDLAWAEYLKEPDQCWAEVLWIEAHDDPGAARRIRDLAIRDGREDMAHFMRADGSWESEDEQLRPVINMSEPEAQPEPDPWGLRNVGTEPAERAANRAALIARFDQENPQVRHRGDPGGFGHGAPRSFEDPGPQRVGMTWSDGSPAIDTTGRPLHTGELNDLSGPMYQNDDRLAATRDTVAALRQQLGHEG